MTRAPAPPRRRHMTLGRSMPSAAFAVMAATVAAGMWLARHDGRELGLPFPPFVGGWDPAITAWALVAAALFALAVLAAPRALALPPAAFAAAVFLLTLALRLALGATSRGTGGWSRVFDPASFEGPNEYLPALSALQYGQGFFLDRFAELVPALPVHAAGHPPGLAARDGHVRHHDAGQARGAVHRRRRARRPARVRARAPGARRPARPVRRAAHGDRAVRAAVRGDVGGRAVRLGRAARRLAARLAPPAPRALPARCCSRSLRCSRGRCSRSVRGPRCSPGGGAA